MTKYKVHDDTDLVKMFRNKPYQGQTPEKAKFIFVGNDANYPPQVLNNDEFKKFLVEYHENGVEFWKKYDVHHPFLLGDRCFKNGKYPFRRDKHGGKYHSVFKKIGLESEFADSVSFVELLDVPTIGITSTNMKEMERNLKCEHLMRLEEIMLNRGNSEKKLIFVTDKFVRKLQKIKKRCKLFTWLNHGDIVRENSPKLLFDGEFSTIYKIYSFSASISNSHIHEIRDLILARNG